MATGFQLHPAIGAGLAALSGPNPPPPLPAGDVENRRKRLDGLFDAVVNSQPQVTDVDVKEFFLKASDGHQLLTRWFTKRGGKAPGSAVLYAHGGGMIALNLNVYDAIIKRYVSNTGVPFLAVDYRLAPEVQAPIPVTDMYVGLQYLHSHAAELGVDPNQIAIMGDSAGGGISASLAHYIKSQGGPSVSKQILIYPMLDDRNVKHEDHASYAPFATWQVDDNITGWQALLGSKLGGSSVTPIEAAGRATAADVKGLPPAYIDVGELDIFRDEDLEYARTLGKGGVSCEIHVLPSCNHAFEVFAPDSEPARFVMDRRYNAIRSIGAKL